MRSYPDSESNTPRKHMVDQLYKTILQHEKKQNKQTKKKQVDTGQDLKFRTVHNCRVWLRPGDGRSCQ